MSRNRWMVLGLLLAMSLTWAFPWGGLGQDQPVIRLGGTLSETGRLAATAALYIDGRNLALDVINAGGGVVIGGVSYQLEMVLLDDQSDADLAVRLYTQLAEEDQVDFFLGPYSSGIVLPTSVIAEQFKIPMVEGGGASTNIFDRGFKYVFGTLPAGTNYLQNAIKLFKEQAGAQTMGLVYADDAFSTNVAEGARLWAAEYGLQIVADEKYADGQTEFSSLIAKLKDQNPDVVMGANHLAEMLAFVPQARSLGLLSDLVFTVGTENQDFLALGDVAEGVFGVTPWLTDQDTSGDTFGSASDYTEMFEGRFGFTPEYHNANGSVEILIYKKAIEAAGSLDREAVRNAIAGISFDSFYGPVSFSEDGQIGTGQSVIQIQNGVSVGVLGGTDPIFNSRR